MFSFYNNDWGFGWGGGDSIWNPAYPKLIASGYDRNYYISTAQLQPSPYFSQELIVAKIGGLASLINAVDDDVPPTENLQGDALAAYNAVCQNVTTEINGYLSSIYPIPLAQTGTVAVIQVTGLSTDGNNSITSIQVIEGGNYLTPPIAVNTPAFLKYSDPLWQARYFEWNQQYPLVGAGAEFTVTYETQNYSDESGQVLQTYTIDGTPTITSGGTNYCMGDLLVLTGGTSMVPAKVREAALILICHSFYQRRIAPEEKNIFDPQARYWRKFFEQIGEGETQLDGTYKRFFTPATSWNVESVLNGANSL